MHVGELEAEVPNLSALTADPLARARTLIIAWVAIAILEPIPFAFAPRHISHASYVVMGWVALAVLLVLGATIIADRDSIAEDRALAATWVNIGWVAPALAFVYRSWIALGIGVLIFGYAIVLRRWAGPVAARELIAAHND